jgi:hypothetical protein
LTERERRRGKEKGRERDRKGRENDRKNVRLREIEKRKKERKND